MSVVLPEDFRFAMRRFPASVNVVTTNVENRCYGFTATAVSSLSDRPPTLLACVNCKSRTFQAIRQSGSFAVNVLEKGQVEIAKTFAQSEHAERVESFRSPQWTLIESDSPILENSIVAFDCLLKHSVEYETHSILIGEVVFIRRGNPNADNLLYMDGDFRTISPLYQEACPRAANS